MKIDLDVVDLFDGLTRVLQVLRLARCEVVALSADGASGSHTVSVSLIVPPGQDDLVLARLRQVIGVRLIAADRLGSGDVREWPHAA